MDAWPKRGEGLTGAAVVCSACGLVVRSWVEALAPRYCPRCLARRRVAVEMEPVQREARVLRRRAPRPRLARASGLRRSRRREGRSGRAGSAGGRLALELPRASAAPRIARLRLTEWLGAELDRSGLEDAPLLVSELVTNAVVHGRGRIQLRAQLDDGRLLVHVFDGGDGFAPSIRERRVDGGGGRGLGIVEAAASQWGVRQGTADVWFELDRRPPLLPGAAG